ncbi:PIN domain-containing protein [Pelomonas aquatica]|jgi:putative PIN family toxin of toxin-antitoxin system|uniref:PIN domain-containing protein n=1 Tax=Pelomonas aquatica TaxID=431058 RepID=A0A9X4LKF3_9BURK|nr:PIN domain-containing protein [Pelomonas aquatica]MCY4757245.1 PIN domain-containing protein [Pelomonas aquatica]MDG0865250.1 PIN domain-containing protein [Pelomonas aquatica]
MDTAAPHASAIDGPDALPAIVIDTQVVMDWLVFRDARVAALTAAVTSGALRWLVAPAMRDEIRHVLGRGVAASYTPDLAFIEAQLDAHAVAVDAIAQQPLAGRLVCRDPDDQKFIDLALSGGARWLVSRDKAVLALARRALPRGLLIVKPENFRASE